MFQVDTVAMIAKMQEKFKKDTMGIVLIVYTRLL